jgi:hypothetical protein
MNDLRRETDETDRRVSHEPLWHEFDVFWDGFGEKVDVTFRVFVDQTAFPTAGFYHGAPNMLYCVRGGKEGASQARPEAGSPEAGRRLDRQHQEVKAEAETGGQMAEGNGQMSAGDKKPISLKRFALRLPAAIAIGVILGILACFALVLIYLYTGGLAPGD